LTVLEAAAACVELPDECVDFAIARFLFQHLAGPALAISELHRLLKPGGTLAMVDIDDDLAAIVDPWFPSFGVLGHKVGQLQSWRGGNRNVGRKLWRLLKHEGLEDLALDTVAIHSDETGVEAFWPQLDPDRYKPFIADGGLTETEWQAYRDDVNRFMAAPSAYILHLLFVVSGKKHAVPQ
jgi:SAM-dependent methyltransferase